MNDLKEPELEEEEAVYDPAQERKRPTMRKLQDAQQTIERSRIQASNRYKALQRYADESGWQDPMLDVYRIISEHEQKLEGVIDVARQEEVEKFLVYDDWLKHVQGIGPSLAAQVLAWTSPYPPRADMHPTTWWHQAGINARTHVEKWERLVALVDHDIGIDDTSICQSGVDECDGDDSPSWGFHRIGEEILQVTELGTETTYVSRGALGTSTTSHAKGAFIEKATHVRRRLPRARKGGGRITYHPGFRRSLFLVSRSFVLGGRFYREQYVSRKDRLTEQHLGTVTGTKTKTVTKDDGTTVEKEIPISSALAKDGSQAWSRFDIDRAARWATIKLFLSHLWEMWCESEGIPFNPQTYAQQYLGHNTVIHAPRWDGKNKI